MAEAEDAGWRELSGNGMPQAVMAAVASGSLAALIAYMHPAGYPFWLAGIGFFFALSLGLSLRIHALYYRDGLFRGDPLLGKPIEFRGSAIAAIANDDRSRPPRARIDLKDGRRLLVKKPLGLGPVTAADFERKIRERLAAG